MTCRENLCKMPHITAPDVRPNKAQDWFLGFFFCKINLLSHMPKSAPRPCRAYGCSALVHDDRGFCARHIPVRQRSSDSNRASSAARGYGYKWQKARAAYLRRHPLCCECAKSGLLVAATDVDHIQPHRGDRNLFWDQSNWQSLCSSCHSRKTIAEGGSGGWSDKTAQSATGTLRSETSGDQ